MYLSQFQARWILPSNEIRSDDDGFTVILLFPIIFNIDKLFSLEIVMMTYAGKLLEWVLESTSNVLCAARLKTQMDETGSTTTLGGEMLFVVGNDKRQNNNTVVTEI